MTETIANEQPELMGTIDLYVDEASDEWSVVKDVREVINACVTATLNRLPEHDTPIELCVRLTDDADIQTLNRDFRGKDKATNVLSFPGFVADELSAACDLAKAGGPPVLLGDIVITYGVTSFEAREQKKSFENHLRHLTVHGLLHLMGFDHIEDVQAEEMEALEREILACMGVDDPYKVDEPYQEGHRGG